MMLATLSRKNLEKNGVIIHRLATLRTVRKKSDYLEIVLDYDDGHSTVVEVDIILISIGRDPNTAGLSLENAGIETTNKGYLKINEACALSNLGDCTIFAAGDVTGQKALYGVAEEQGRYIVEAIFGKTNFILDYSHMPTLMFFKPELAAVGANEKMLRSQRNSV